MTTENNRPKTAEEMRLRLERQRLAELQFYQLLASILKGFGTDKPSQEQLAVSATQENTPESVILSHPLFKMKYPERVNEIANSQNKPEQFNHAATASLPAPRPSVLADPGYVDTALRAAVSLGIERYANDCMARGVKYGFNVKDGKTSIDCSGFVQKSIQTILASTGMADQSYAKMFQTHADGQVQALARLTNYKLQGDQVNLTNIKAGMVIGFDSGDKKWDRGRVDGIDHITIVFADSKTGKLMVAESRGGVGVMTSPLDKFLEQAHKKGYKLFAADVVGLASSEFKKSLEAHAPKTDLLTASAHKPAGLTIPVT